MRNRIAGLAATVVIGFTLIAADAEAARVGGGRNVGRQSQSAPPAATPQQGVSQSQQAPSQAAAARPGTPAAAAPAQPARNRWLAPLAGLAAGLGLAALFSHLGMGAQMAEFMMNFLMIALLAMAAFVVYRLIMSRRAAGGARPAAAGAGYGSAPMGSEASVNYQANQGQSWPGAARTGEPSFGRPALAGSGFAASAEPNSVASRIPAGFDVDGFLQGARQQFVRLQAAFDAASLSDLREFTADELYPELARQITERGAAAQRTDVVQLNAELLSVETQGLEYVASVRFNGMIRESEHDAATPFDEVWNLTKPVAGGSGWLLAGIQQLS